ncbi:MAG: DUF3096 domain-containing protein [Firmicutes bacterium]|nr:DUF3096 domain-containing protein [Bacillota bacterium]
MNYSFITTAILAILFGALIFIFPQALSYAVAAYLVVVGISGLINARRN